MPKSLGIAGLALTLGGCVYTPVGGPSVPPVAGGYTVNDNGYMAYYTTQTYPTVDCKSDTTWRCRDRFEYDAAFCSEWETSGRCGDAAVVTEPSEEVSPPPPGGRGWWIF